MPTIEPRTVMPFSTMPKMSSGKSPGGRPFSATVPPRPTMPIACSKALRLTAVTSTPWAPPPVSRRITVAGSSCSALTVTVGAQPAGEVELGVVDVDRGDVQAHRPGVLHRHVAEPADARDHHPVAGLGVGHLQTLVDGDAGAEDRRDLDEVDVGRQVADEVRVGHHVFGEAAVHRIAGVLLALAERLPAAEAVPAVAAGGVEPRHADPVALLDVLDARADARRRSRRPRGRG